MLLFGISEATVGDFVQLYKFAVKEKGITSLTRFLKERVRPSMDRSNFGKSAIIAEVILAGGSLKMVSVFIENYVLVVVVVMG